MLIYLKYLLNQAWYLINKEDTGNSERTSIRTYGWVVLLGMFTEQPK